MTKSVWVGTVAGLIFVVVLAVIFLGGKANRQPVAIAEPEDVDGEVLENTDRLLGNVGDYEMRLRRMINDEGGSRPMVVNYYEVIDKKTTKPVKATDLFSEESIVKALAATVNEEEYEEDPATKKAYSDLKNAKTYSAVSEAVDALQAPLYFEMGEQCRETLAFEPATENFAIIAYDSSKKKVALHFGVASSSHMCEATFPRLKLWVDAPEKLQPSLAEASQKIGGAFPSEAELKACEHCEPIDFTQVELGGG